MSQGITNFANSWVFENINADAYDPGHEIIAAHVARLISDAKEEGISVDQLKEELGDLSTFISEAMEDATDDEVDRLVSKGD